MIRLLTKPLARHVLAVVFILGIGFYIGNSLMQKRFRKAKMQTSAIEGKYSELSKAYTVLGTRLDTLQATLVKLAGKEAIAIENHFSNNKIKRGGKASFEPLNQVATDTVSNRGWWIFGRGSNEK